MKTNTVVLISSLAALVATGALLALSVPGGVALLPIVAASTAMAAVMVRP